ncbi:MAG: hypothetical protein WA705_02330 [Candidatus Ozemobacteraceae bacterium]
MVKHMWLCGFIAFLLYGGVTGVLAEDKPILKPIPALEKLIKEGKINGIDAGTGLTAVLWIESKIKGGSNYNYYICCRIKDQNGKWIPSTTSSNPDLSGSFCLDEMPDCCSNGRLFFKIYDSNGGFPYFRESELLFDVDGCLTGFTQSKVASSRPAVKLLFAGKKNAGKVFAKDLIIQPLKTLEDLALTGKIQGVDPSTGNEAFFWVESKKEKVPGSKLICHRYHCFWKIVKSDGSIVTGYHCNPNKTFSDDFVIVHPPEEMSSNILRYFAPSGEGSTCGDYFKMTFDRKGSIASFDFAYRFIKEEYSLRLIFGEEREKFLFQQIHKK